MIKVKINHNPEKITRYGHLEPKSSCSFSVHNESTRDELMMKFVDLLRVYGYYFSEKTVREISEVLEYTDEVLDE